MKALRPLPLLLTAGLATAAVPGVPEPGPAGVAPEAVVSTFNDMFANGLGNKDDFRTAGLAGQFRLGRIGISAEAAMLTDRYQRTRSDQAIVLLGGWAGPLQPRLGWHGTAFAGVGVQDDGDLHGQQVQNAVHRRVGADHVDLAYDPARGVRPVIGASAAVGWLGSVPQGLILTGSWGVQVVASGSAVEDGETLGEIGPRLVLVGRQGAFWVGPRFRYSRGDAAGPTSAVTLDHEDGWWIDSGTFVTPLTMFGREAGWQIRAGINPVTWAALGSVGLVVQPGGSPLGPTLDMQHDLAIYDGGGMGVQLRWYPFPFQDLHRSALVGDYSFGTDPEGRLANAAGTVVADLRHDQFTLAWEEGVRTPEWRRMRLAASIQGGGGVRSEGMVADDPNLDIDRSRSTAMVLRGSGAVRLEICDTLGLGVSLDGWLPLWHRRATAPDGDALILDDPGWTVGMHAIAHVAW